MRDAFLEEKSMFKSLLLLLLLLHLFEMSDSVSLALILENCHHYQFIHLGNVQARMVAVVIIFG